MRPPLRRRLLVVAFLLSMMSHPLAAAAPASPTPPGPAPAASRPAFDPSRFEATTLVTDMDRPMELAIAPDGAVFWIELGGKLKRYDPKTRAITLVAEITVTTAQENGLIGIALDPDFSKNHWVYLQYSPPDYPGQHISRFTLSGGKLDMASEKVLLKFTEQREQCCHHAGSIEFGPDGCLFISTGDNTHPHGDSKGYAPIDERDGRSPWDAQKSAANTNHLSGKILRIKPTPDGKYTIPKGNLFTRHKPDPGNPDAVWGLPEIYVMGCRNPWRISVDQKTGYLYWGEVGPDAGGDGERGPRGYDEVNQAKRAGNFGWPYFIGNNKPYHDVDFATEKVGPLFDVKKPINASVNNTGSRVLPPPTGALIYYPGGDSKEFPVVGKGGRTACAGPVYHYDEELDSPTKFPKAFDNTLFPYEWSRHWIMAAKLDGQGNLKRLERFMPQYNFVRPIDMAFGPEGSLYVIEYGTTWGKNDNAKIIRIDYVRGNRSPHAHIAVSDHIGKGPVHAKFDGGKSSDRDGDALSYQWQLSPPTGPIIGTQATAKHTFTKPGVYNVALTVKDKAGAAATASVAVMVGNAYPKVTIEQPRDGDFFEPGQPLSYRVAVEDEEDGDTDFDATSLSPRVYVTGSFIENATKKLNDEDLPVGLQLMKKSDCFNCHAVDRKVVGPALIEVAKKYVNSDPHATDKALNEASMRVQNGSTGVWGKLPMLPHKQHTLNEIKAMVGWVFSLKDQQSNQAMQRGITGQLTPKLDNKQKDKAGRYVISAVYNDMGAGAVGSLSGKATVSLRMRKIEAEAFDFKHKMQVLGSKIGDISHGGYLRYDNINLQGSDRVTFRVASGGHGGHVEMRLKSPTGPLLCRVETPNTGGWGKWIEKTAAIHPPAGVHDVVILFVNEEKQGGGMMDLDWFYVHAKK